MRSLTDAEARVVSVLLADTAVAERERLSQSGVPRSTYHAVRRRAYAERWLRDRYVPAPAALGYEVLRFALARPYADQRTHVGEAWAARPAAVVVALDATALLGVFLYRSEAEAERERPGLWSPAWGATVWTMELPTRGGAVPVYFDYEGCWSHLARSPGARGYPQGLPDPPGGAAPTPAWNARRRWAHAELVRRPFEAMARGSPGHLVGVFGLPGAQRQLLEDGTVRHRVLADPGRLPAFRGRAMERQVLITGTLRSGVAPESLLATLLGECRVFPFLFASDRVRVLVGAMGAARGAAAPEVGPAPRRAVMATFHRALESIDVHDEAAASVRMVLDHRYDRLGPP